MVVVVVVEDKDALTLVKFVLNNVCFPRVSFYRQRSIEVPALSMSRISSSSDEVGHEASIYAFFYFARLFSCFQPRPNVHNLYLLLIPRYSGATDDSPRYALLHPLSKGPI